MTWQRIDENTYIDGTLVTCVEYQLFIDDMRRKNKHLQPDQWNDLQFEAGHAYNPVVGIRLSDARDFCKWMSMRDGRGWKYRLPKEVEAKTYLPDKSSVHPLGYWMHENGMPNFVWVGQLPTNARRIGDDILQTMDLNAYLKRINDCRDRSRRNLMTNLINDRNRSHGTDRIGYFLRYIQFRTIYLVTKWTDPVIFTKSQLISFLISAVERTNNRALDIYLSRQNAPFVDEKPEPTNEIAVVGSDIDNVVNWRDMYLSDRGQTIDNAILLSLDYTFDGIAKMVDDVKVDKSLDLALDMLTLKERIAGRSPAFEGIRLVKERIR